MIKFEFNGIRFSRMDKYIFHSYEGLNEGEIVEQIGQYLGQDGADVLSSNYEPRIVTLNGHILADSDRELFLLRQRLVKACNGKTKDFLRYNNGYDGYFGEAIAELPIFGETKGFGLPFSINFKLYNFYWKNQKEYINPILKRTHNLGGTFKFPLVITSKTTKTQLLNNGDVACPLKLEVTGYGVSVGTDGFKIINNTTGEFIQLNYNITDGEIVTIDTQELTIISSLNGNILHKITNESKLDLKLQIGANEVECVNYASNEILITAYHYDLHVGV